MKKLTLFLLQLSLCFSIVSAPLQGRIRGRRVTKTKHVQQLPKRTKRSPHRARQPRKRVFSSSGRRVHSRPAKMVVSRRSGATRLRGADVQEVQVAPKRRRSPRRVTQWVKNIRKAASRPNQRGLASQGDGKQNIAPVKPQFYFEPIAQAAEHLFYENTLPALRNQYNPGTYGSIGGSSATIYTILKGWADLQIQIATMEIHYKPTTSFAVIRKNALRRYRAADKIGSVNSPTFQSTLNSVEQSTLKITLDALEQISKWEKINYGSKKHQAENQVQIYQKPTKSRMQKGVARKAIRSSRVSPKQQVKHNKINIAPMNLRLTRAQQIALDGYNNQMVPMILSRLGPNSATNSTVRYAINSGAVSLINQIPY